MAIIDMTGQRFGQLTVLYRDETKPRGHGHRAYWVCKCDCGNIKSIEGYHLRSGATKSCGCLQRKRSHEANFQDIAGQRFGFLVPLYPTGEKKWKKTIWHCKCLNCGNEVDVIHSYLTSGETKSCGCLKSSYGETQINQLLTDHHINFIREYSFEDCKSKQGIKLRFDFAIFMDTNIKCLIEFQGMQHEHAVEWFGGEEAFKASQERDDIKRQYCKKNNIPLIEIPYSDRDKIDWNYLKEKCNL